MGMGGENEQGQRTWLPYCVRGGRLDRGRVHERAEVGGDNGQGGALAWEMSVDDHDFGGDKGERT